jgi:hypothetical protein
MMHRLDYRRQFLLATGPVTELESWKHFQVGEYFLHVHPDLEVTVACDSHKSITLVGYLFDPDQYRQTNQDILLRMLAESIDLESLILALKRLTGRYAIFFQDHKNLVLLHDALALREVYYCESPNNVICGSQPNLLERFSVPKIHKSFGPEIQDFVINHLPRVRDGRLWPGDGSPFEAVKHLLPNHFLDIHQLKTVRYWPNSRIPEHSLNDAIKLAATFLQGAMKAALNRYPLMMAVTAGEDSRTLLAASKDICDSIYFFINKHDRLKEKNADIRIPTELFRRIGIPFHVHTYSKDVPPDFKEVFKQNTFYAKEGLLAAIYNVYYKQHQEKVNILGVGEVGRTKFFEEPQKVTPYYLAYMLRYRSSRYAVKECQRWLEATQQVAHSYKLNIMTLFWWEVLIGNWGAVGNSESDVAIEEFDPYNSHFLYETFLSVDAKFRTFRENILFRELIRSMWPQLLDVAFNPPDSAKDKLNSVLHKIGFEYVLRRTKAMIAEFYFRFRHKRGRLV